MKTPRHIVKKTLLMISILLCGCQNTKIKQENNKNFFEDLRSYEATATVSFLKDRQPNVLVMKQQATIEGSYVMTYLSPAHLEGTQLCYNGEKIVEIYPKENKEIEEKVGRVENEVLLTSVAKRLLAAPHIKEQQELFNGKKVRTYDIPIEGGYKYLAREKVWLSQEQRIPIQLEIYDTEGNLSIQVVYNDFKYNS